MSKIKCVDCCYYWQDEEHDDFPCCHFGPEEALWVQAPCEEPEEEFVFPEDALRSGSGLMEED